MKKIARFITLLSILAITVSSFGCNSNYSEKATNNTNEYICIQGLEKYYDEKEEEWNFKYVYHYNGLGFQDSQISYIETKDQDFVPYFIGDIKCDSKGNMIHYREPGTYNNEAYYENEYDDNDKLIKTIITSDDTYGYVDIVEYEYDEKGLLKKETGLNDNSVSYITEEYEYDNYGNLIKCVTRYSSGGYTIREYEYMKLDKYLKMIKNEKLELKGTWVDTEDLLSDEEDEECGILSFDGTQVKEYLGIVNGEDITPIKTIDSYDYNIQDNGDNGKIIESWEEDSNSFYNGYAISSDGKQKYLYISNENDYSGNGYYRNGTMYTFIK